MTATTNHVVTKGMTQWNCICGRSGVFYSEGAMRSFTTCDGEFIDRDRFYADQVSARLNRTEEVGLAYVAQAFQPVPDAFIEGVKRLLADGSLERMTDDELAELQEHVEVLAEHVDQERDKRD